MKKNLRKAVLGCVLVTLMALSGASQADDPIERVKAATVSIWAGEKSEIRIGSGFIISPEGHIITNEHVVRGRQNLMAGLNDGKKRPVKVIKPVFKPEEGGKDLALLQIDEPNFKWDKWAVLGNSDKLREGQTVTVIGFPLAGTIVCDNPSRTDGKVSGLDKTITVPVRGQDVIYKGVIQISAQTLPGSSGSPVINEQGEVIGVAVIGGLISLAIPIHSSL